MTESFLQYYAKMLNSPFTNHANKVLHSLNLAIAGVINDVNVNVAVDMMLGENYNIDFNMYKNTNVIIITIQKLNQLNNSKEWSRITMEAPTFCKTFYSNVYTKNDNPSILIGHEILRELGSMMINPSLALTNKLLFDKTFQNNFYQNNNENGRLLVICGESVHDFNIVSQLVNAVIHELEINQASTGLLQGQNLRKIKSYRKTKQKFLGRQRAQSSPALLSSSFSDTVIEKKPWIRFGINCLSYIVGRNFQGSIFSMNNNSISKSNKKDTVSLDNFPDNNEDILIKNKNNTLSSDTGITWMSKESGPVGEAFHDAHLRAIKSLLKGGYNVVSDEFWISKDWIQKFDDAMSDINYTIVKIKRNKNTTKKQPFNQLFNDMNGPLPTPNVADLIINESDIANPMLCAKRILCSMFSKRNDIKCTTTTNNSNTMINPISSEYSES
jgi:hypothetical protein